MGTFDLVAPLFGGLAAEVTQGKSTVELVVLLTGILGGLSGLAALVDVFLRRSRNRAEAGKQNADAAQVITGTAVTWMTEFEEEAKAARAEAAQARKDMRAVRDQAQQDLQAVSDEARKLAAELHRLRTAIMAPGATVEGLRALVTAGPDINGRGF